MFDFFKKNKHKKREVKEEYSKNEERQEASFALYLAFFKSFVINKEKIEKRISSIENLEVDIKIINELDGKDGLYCNIKIGKHKFKLVGIDAPIPQDIMNYTINCAYGNNDELDRMKNHQYHIIAFYEGDSENQNEIFNAYSKLAYGFLEHDLLGLVNGYSWNALIPSLIKGMVEDDEAKDLANYPAMMVWRNFIKMPYKDGVWFVTKGNNLYGIYEYAYFGTFEDTNEVYEIFESIFNYVYETKTPIISGHTLEIEEEVYLKFREVYELEDSLQGESIGTLVIEKIRRDEINSHI